MFRQLGMSRTLRFGTKFGNIHRLVLEEKLPPCLEIFGQVFENIYHIFHRISILKVETINPNSRDYYSFYFLTFSDMFLSFLFLGGLFLQSIVRNVAMLQPVSFSHQVFFFLFSFSVFFYLCRRPKKSEISSWRLLHLMGEADVPPLFFLSPPFFPTLKFCNARLVSTYLRGTAILSLTCAVTFVPA